MYVSRGRGHSLHGELSGRQMEKLYMSAPFAGRLGDANQLAFPLLPVVKGK
jgi:hypothetical protein